MNKYLNISVGIFLACLFSASYAANFAYVANSNDNTISIYSINQSSGALSPLGNPHQLDSKCDHPVAVKISTSQNYLYVLCHMGTLPKLYTYQIDQDKGTLSKNEISHATFQTTMLPITNMQMVGFNTPNGDDHLYIAVSTNDGNFSVSEYLVNKGQISTPAYITEHLYVYTGTILSMTLNNPLGLPTYLYAETPKNVIYASINPNNGSLTYIDKISVVSNGSSTEGQIKFSPLGNFLYVVEGNSNPNISQFTVSPTDGSISQQQVFSNNSATGIAFATNVNWMGTSPSQEFVYTVNNYMITSYIMNLTNGGTFTDPEINGTIGIQTNTPNAIKVDPTGKFAYVIDGNFIYSYKLDLTSGGMSFINKVKAGNEPSAIAFAN